MYNLHKFNKLFNQCNKISTVYLFLMCPRSPWIAASSRQFENRWYMRNNTKTRTRPDRTMTVDRVVAGCRRACILYSYRCTTAPSRSPGRARTLRYGFYVFSWCMFTYSYGFHDHFDYLIKIKCYIWIVYLKLRNWTTTTKKKNSFLMVWNFHTI